MSLGNPTQLTRDMVAGVEAKYGCSLVATCPEEVRRPWEEHTAAWERPIGAAADWSSSRDAEAVAAVLDSQALS